MIQKKEAYGRPMTEAGFTKWFGECVFRAGLPSDLSPPLQIAAITGHASLKEV